MNSNAGSFNAQNSSVVPLDAGDVFTGLYSSTLDFSIITVSLNCDSKYNLDVYFSHDGFNDDSIQSIIVSSVPAETQFYVFEPKMRYFKLKLTNTSSTQTYLTLQTILKSSFIYQDLSGINVNTDISGQSVRVSNLLDLSGLNVVNNALDNCITNNNQVNIKNTGRHNQVLWATSATGINGVSAIANMTDHNIQTISIYGNSDGASIFTLQFSNDGTTFYDSSYTITITPADFGSSFQISPRYLRLKSSNSVGTNTIINAC